MSFRESWPRIASSVVDGDVITGCRDNDTRTYRLVVNKGMDYGTGGGSSRESGACCDLSLEDVKRLHAVLGEAISAHRPWPPPETEDDYS